jgi:hypothetical protein
LIRQLLYEAEGRNDKFIPLVLSHANLSHIPLELRGGTHYVLDGEEGYESLSRRLTGQPAIIREKLGSLRPLPPRNRTRSLPLGEEN